MRIEIDTKARIVRIYTNNIAIQNADVTIDRNNMAHEKANGHFTSKDGDTASLGRQIDRLLRGELKRQEQLQIFETVPALYQKMGFERQPVLMNQQVFGKATKDKHAVPVDTIRKLPQLLRKPICVLQSKTDSTALVSIIDQKDIDGLQILVVMRPSNNGQYIAIPSMYGKDDIIKLIKTSKLKYKRPL